MSVSVVQAAGGMGATRRGGGAFQSWVKPTEAPGVMRWRRCRANGSAAARCPYLRCTSAGRESLTDEIASQRLSQSGRLCSPLTRYRAGPKALPRTIRGPRCESQRGAIFAAWKCRRSTQSPRATPLGLDQIGFPVLRGCLVLG
jgi:hypothetical protein